MLEILTGWVKNKTETITKKPVPASVQIDRCPYSLEAVSYICCERCAICYYRGRSNRDIEAVVLCFFSAVPEIRVCVFFLGLVLLLCVLFCVLSAGFCVNNVFM